MPSLWWVFTTGLISGGVSCMAVQGGLLAAVIAGSGKKKYAILAFVVAKLVAHIILGLGLGWLGTKLQLTPVARGVMQMAAAGYMLAIALALWDVHPIFRRFLFQTPKWLGKLVRGQAKSTSILAPGILGAFTVFIPCGTTQAMMALAISTGNPIWGAMVMGSFVLGTTPVFILLGAGMSLLGKLGEAVFRKLGAALVLGMAVWSLWAGANLVGVRIDVGRRIYCALTYCTDIDNYAAVTEVNVEILNDGYKLDKRKIKAGEVITLNLINENGQGCTQVFTVPALGLNELVTVGESKTIKFRAPEKAGQLGFSCGMGMYGGTFVVE